MSYYGYPFFKTWLAYSVVFGLIAAGVGMLVGSLVLGVMESRGFDLENPEDARTMGFVMGAANLIVSLPISFVIFRWSVMRFLLGEAEGTEGPASLAAFLSGRRSE